MFVWTSSHRSHTKVCSGFLYVISLFLFLGRNLNIYREKKKILTYLLFLVRKKSRTSLLLISRQILCWKTSHPGRPVILEDLSSSVIRYFIRIALKQCRNFQSYLVSLSISSPPPLFPCVSNSLWSTVVQMKFWGWFSSCLLLCETSEFTWGLAQLCHTNQRCPHCAGDACGLVLTLTFSMVCGCKYQPSYATPASIPPGFPLLLVRNNAF